MRARRQRDGAVTAARAATSAGTVAVGTGEQSHPPTRANAGTAAARSDGTPPNREETEATWEPMYYI